MHNTSRLHIDALIRDIRKHGEDREDPEGLAYSLCCRWRKMGAQGTYDEIALLILDSRNTIRKGAGEC